MTHEHIAFPEPTIKALKKAHNNAVLLIEFLERTESNPYLHEHMKDKLENQCRLTCCYGGANNWSGQLKHDILPEASDSVVSGVGQVPIHLCPSKIIEEEKLLEELREKTNKIKCPKSKKRKLEREGGTTETTSIVSRTGLVVCRYDMLDRHKRTCARNPLCHHSYGGIFDDLWRHQYDQIVAEQKISIEEYQKKRMEISS